MDQLLEQIKHITSGGSCGCELLNTWRTEILQVLSDMVTDYNKDKYTSMIEVMFEVLTYHLDNSPEMFVLLDQDMESEQHKSYAFTSGVIYHLLILMSQPRSEDLHSSAGSFITRLLQLIKSREPGVLKKLLSELIFCLADLVTIETGFYTEGLQQIAELKRILPRFSETTHQSHDIKSSKSLFVQDLDTCARLQISISQILIRMLPDICQYAPEQSELLWASVNYQLEYGEIQLKTISLRLLKELLVLIGLPQPMAVDYYVDCLVSLVDLLSSGASDCQGDYASLECELSMSLKALLSACLRSDLVYSNTEQMYEHIAMDISMSITKHGLGKLNTVDLKKGLCDTLAELGERLKAADYNNRILHEQSQRVVDHLMREIDDAADAQYMVNFIVFSYQEEKYTDRQTLKRSASCNRKDKSIPTRHQPEIDSIDMEAGCDLPDTYKPLLMRLSTNCAEVQSMETLKSIGGRLEGIRVILEIIAWSRIKMADTCMRDRAEKECLLSGGIVSQVISAWSHVLFGLVKNRDEQCTLIYDYIVRGIGALTQLMDASDIDVSVQQFIVWVLSIPWLLGEISWKDLKPPEFRKITSLANVIADKIDAGSQTVCIQLLAGLPKDVMPMWRAHVMQLTMASMEIDVRCSAMRNLPIYLCQSGPNANHLLQNSLYPMLKDANENIQRVLAQSIGPLACILARTTVLHSSSNYLPSEKYSFDSLIVKCKVCQHLTEDMFVKFEEILRKIEAKEKVQHEKRPCKEQQRSVDPKLFVPIIEAMVSLPASMNTVKIDMLKGFPCLLSHIDLAGNNLQATKLLKLCMDLMKDKDYTIRLEFSKIIHHFVPAVDGARHLEMAKAIVYHVKEITSLCCLPENMHLLDTVLLTVGEIAKVAEDELLLSMLLILLDHVCLKPTQLASAVAYGQVKEVAKYKKQKETHFIMLYGRKLLKLLVDHLHDAQSGKLDREPLDILNDVTRFFGFSDSNYFLRRSDYMLLPHIVRKATPAASSLLRLVGKQLNNNNHRTALNENMRHIFCHLVCSCENDELRRTLVFLETEMEWKLGDILKAQSNINFELLLHLASDPNKVLTGLKILIARSESCQDISNTMLVEALQPCLLGILVHFDNYLNNGTNPLIEKYKAYKSLVPLMKLMKKEHITRVRLRLMTTLNSYSQEGLGVDMLLHDSLKFEQNPYFHQGGIGLNFKDGGFPELCCTAWSCFIHTLDLTAVGTMLSQIVVNLLPLIQSLPGLAVPILEYLIIDNREVLEQHFNELYFLPDTQELLHINAVLKTYTEAVYKCEGLATHIEHLLKGVMHESLDVRQLALTKLKTLLRLQQTSLQKLVLGSETVDPIISLIVKTLLEGCRESDQNLRSLHAECLGELGAIDPGRLDLLSSQPKQDLTQFHATITEENFAFGFLNELAKSFLRADNRTTQDCVSFAIQELIQIFGITADSDSSSSGAMLWRRFCDEVKEILTPLFESKYTINTVYDWSNQPHPIYCSKKCKDFEKWVSTLTGYLSSKVKSEKPLCILDACRGVMKYVSQMALYLLPHVIVHVLLEGREDDQEELVQEILAVLHHVTEPDSGHTSASDLRHMSAQTVFSVLDHLITWCRHRLMIVSHAVTRSRGRAAPLSAERLGSDPHYQCIQTFLSRIPQDLLARASYNCGAFSRALMHFEQYLKTLKSNVYSQENYDFLQKLYIALHEPDGVTGITAVKQSAPTLGEEIKAFESMGQLSDASVCYDRAIQLEPDNLSYRKGLLCCRLALGELQSAMGHANGMIAEKPNWSSQLNAYRVEASWKLGQWDKLDIYLRPEEKSRDWNVGLGKILLAAKNKNEVEVRCQLHILRCQQMAPLSAASMEVGSYQRGYEYIMRLHILNEIEMGMTTLFNFNLAQDMTQTGQEMEPPANLADLAQHWHHRLQFTQSSYQTQEPILNVRRIMLSLAKQDHSQQVEKEIGQTWLEMARIARECGFIQTAHSSLLSASVYNLSDYCLENAKWLWDRGNYDKAQACLEQAIEDNYHDRSKWKTEEHHGSNEGRLACAKILLLLGRYCEETASWESNAIMRQYREVQLVHGEWEDGYFYIGKYYDKIMVQLIETEKPEKKGEFIMKIVQNFGQSLMYGSQFIYQTMPRMLTLWLDYGAEVVEISPRIRNEVQLHSMRGVVSQLNMMIGRFCAELAPYQFLTAFPQLISRICHAHHDVFNRLKDIIARLMVEFPQQAMWMMMAVSKSSYQMRVRRCQDIFHQAKSMNRELGQFLLDSTKLTDRLLDLCNRTVDTGTSTLSITQHFKPLHRLIDDSNFSPILLPLQSQMTPLLPSSTISPGNHNCFPVNQVYIKGIEDTVEVLPSLQRPKKITFRGSNGHLYIMLCKPKDDLRKDGRLMEFNGIINKCLRKDPESRRRNLHMRTYTVAPLNEECGLLEWVSNTSGLRHIIMKLYKERGLYTSGKELKAMQLPSNAPFEKKKEVYVNMLLPRHPALFSEWFLKTFSDPTSWYNARLAYSRTVAVMSMVGYVLGLGDRHGENILFDSTSGDCVHVDFNCLFNKGETFDYPEIVPFRLTHNMIEAMGPMGFEGLFRRACEVTLRVMRDQTDPLMSVLRTFIYDPLVEWSKPARGKSNASDTGETKNEKAQTHIVNIESRLRGVLKNKTKPRGLPLSVEGQVNHLLKEATNTNNLCQMYIGWAAYM